MKCFFHKLINYEYYPWYFWHTLLLPFHIWNAIKCKSLFYYTSLNPGLGNSGGFFADSKKKMLGNIPKSFLLNECILINNGDEIKQLEKQLISKAYSFPLVFKPEMGERGIGVAIIFNLEMAKKYLKNVHQYPIIVQDYCDYKLEFGLFVAKLPDKPWSILGVTGKLPMQVIGDGKSDVETLLANDCRYKSQLVRLKKTDLKLDFVLEADKILVIEHILNHRLGTKFTNCNHLITDQFVQKIADLCNSIDGFYYGRFDIKVADLDNFEAGDFKIIELNGAASEPTIIYDQEKTGFMNSLRLMIKHTLIQGYIAKNNIANGIMPMKAMVFKRVMLDHFKLS